MGRRKKDGGGGKLPTFLLSLFFSQPPIGGSAKRGEEEPQKELKRVGFLGKYVVFKQFKKRFYKYLTLIPFSNYCYGSVSVYDSLVNFAICLSMILGEPKCETSMTQSQNHALDASRWRQRCGEGKGCWREVREHGSDLFVVPKRRYAQA